MSPSHLTLESALALLARGAGELRETGAVEVGPLLAAYRALGPIGHAGAADDVPDLSFLAAVDALALPHDCEVLRVDELVPRAPPSGTRLAVASPRVGVLRIAPGPEATADALSIACGLALEAAKLDALGADDEQPLAAVAAALEMTQEEAAAALGTVSDANDRLRQTMRGGVARRVEAVPRAAAAERLDEVLFDVAVSDEGPLFVVAGATERLQDLLSPWVRRLEPALARLAGSSDADDVYAALPLLLAEEPGAHDERLDVEAREGIAPCGAALVLRFSKLDPARADARARTLARTLKQNRATLVLCDREPSSLGAVLSRAGKRARVIAVLGESLGGSSPCPDVVVEALTGQPLDLDNALTDVDDERDAAAVVVSPPSLGLSPVAYVRGGVGCAPLLSPLLLEAVRARARGDISRRARLAAATFAPGDSAAASSVALRCLSRMAGAEPLARRQTRRP